MSWLEIICITELAGKSKVNRSTFYQTTMLLGSIIGSLLNDYAEHDAISDLL